METKFINRGDPNRGGSPRRDCKMIFLVSKMINYPETYPTHKVKKGDVQVDWIRKA